MAKPPNIEVLTTVPFPESVMQKLKTLTPRIKVNVHPAQQVEEIPLELLSKAEVLYTDTLLPDPTLFQICVGSNSIMPVSILYKIHYSWTRKISSSLT
jgi:hypothetical protein